MPDESTTPVMPPVSDTSVPEPVADASSVPPVTSAPAMSDVDASNVPPVSDVVVTPTVVTDEPVETPAVDTDVPAEVARKIGEAHNVLIALSSDPSVDELAAAIGLSIYLDRLGKRATAIYSGSTPNALEFLNPEETFEPTADTLQDFVIALNKDKADHLRYKLDGDYVKIYITPYKHRLAEDDLEFSYGDYNVDLVLALDVANGIDLDSALREHGRIMHDAVIVNITTGNPGKFGEVEWSDKKASSISEMVARLLYGINSKIKIEKEEATAFLTGIVAATNRFSNAGTTPETMQLASKLMESGANQQLISKNITPDIENEMFGLGSSTELGEERTDSDPTKLDIGHGDNGEETTDETKEVSDTITEKDSTLLDDLKAAEASLATAGAETTPEIGNRPVKLEDMKDDDVVDGEVPDEPKLEATAVPDAVTSTATELPTVAAESPTVVTEPEVPSLPEVPEIPESSGVPEVPVMPEVASAPEVPGIPGMPENEGINGDKPEKVIAPSSDFEAGITDDSADKYGKMLEEALASASNSEPVGNPAMASAPAVPVNPEINGVPSINYMPMPGEEVLPPPPTPPIDMSGSEPVVTEPVVPEPVMTEPAATEPAVPATPATSGQPQPTDASAFRIPGM